MSVIDKQRRSRGNRWIQQAEQRGEPTLYNVVKSDIDTAIRMSMTERQFYQKMKDLGYSFNFSETRKYPTIRAPGQKHNIRFKTLGEDFTPEIISRRILENKRVFVPAQPPKRNIRKYRYRGKFVDMKSVSGLYILDGYELDTDVHAVTVTPGKLATLQLTNTPKSGLRLLKIDSITKKGIFNVEFMVFDSNNNVVGNFYTDDQGVIDFCGILPEGRYTIRETRSAVNYYPDDVPRTVEFAAGKITEIVWENTPRMGQVQILKKSGDDNEVNGLPAGTPLAGAVFEAYDYKSGNLVDRFVSGNDGRAVSAPLPLGRYLIKEVQAPQWYKLSTQQLDVEVEFATQIIKLEHLNYAANTGVYIKKTGNVEAMPGDTIRYDIKAVQNTSTVPLTDFFWRDVLPTDAVRLNKIVTGTYSQSLKYKIMATTNKGDTFLIADNLSSTKNNVIDCSNASLGLRSDEYVTSFSLVFGNVKPGFAQVLTPQIFVTVLKTLPNGYQFANKCDVGGKYGTEWVVSNSTCVTTIYSNSKLPRTGY